MDSAATDFRKAFRRRARSVRAWRGLGYVLSGLSVGALLGGVTAALFWWLGEGTSRPWAAAVATFSGLVLGLWWARRRRWSDQALALYLDARLGSRETVTTALEPGETAAHDDARRSAARTLGSARPGRLRPPLLARWHALFPVGSAAAVWLCVIPLPPAPAGPPPPAGVEKVRRADLPGLDRIEALEGLGAENEAQKERLRRLSAEARRLREDLQRGIEKREALARLGGLRDDIAAERSRFGDAANRAGLDAALDELDRKAATAKAGRALGAGDLTEFDAEMQRLASLAEKEDREAARRALEEAAKAAHEKGAHALADALDRQRRAFDRAETRAEALRELARRLEGALDEEGRSALGDLGKSGHPEAQRKLAEALERSLKKLSEDERRRLAENLSKRLEGGGVEADPMTRRELEELARRLAEKGGDRLLEDALRELARRDPSEDAERDRGLGEADRGGAEAERGLGLLPLPSGGGNAPGGDDASPKQEHQASRGGGRGSGSDEGTADHAGQTAPLDTKELRSKADPKLLPGMPMHSATLGRAAANSGETANQLGTGRLGEAAPSEVGAVEGADIPEEYREQVGRYFEP